MTNEDVTSEAERITTFDQAVRVNAYELARRWGANEWPIRVSLRIAEANDLPAREVADDLEELAVMAALAKWLDRWMPSQIHSTLLAGASVEQVAAASGLDPATMADTWREWSAGQRRMWQTYPDMDRTDEHNRVAAILAGYSTPTQEPER
jgi:hypothetical protein